MVVPYPPGGAADNSARILAKQLENTLKQSIIVENKPGANGSIGAAQVARSDADGYTVLYDSSSFSINPALRKLPYEPLKDFIPVSQVVSSPFVMVVAQNSPITSLDAYVSSAKKEPGHRTYASYGIGSPPHVIGELLGQEIGINAVHVPYQGGAPAVMDTISGVVDTYFANVASSISYIRGEKLKPLAVTSAKRSDELPNVPTLMELGVPVEVNEWNGVFVPAGTPNETVNVLANAIVAATDNPETIKQLKNLGMNAEGTTPDAFKGFIATEIDRWKDVAKRNSIRVD